MSLALLVPDTSVPGGVAASSGSAGSAPEPALADRSGHEVSGSVGLLAGMSPGWDRAELEWERKIKTEFIQVIFHNKAEVNRCFGCFFVEITTCTWTPPVADWCQSSLGE